MPLPARCCRLVRAGVKTVKTKGLSLRGRAAPVAISGRQLRFCRKYPVIQPGSARFPRRFAPRNDKSGGIARSTMSLHNLPACKALAARKGHAASVRRQSRQRLRSERRYRRNRFYHCNDSLFLAPVRRREGHARPLQRAIDIPYHKPYPSSKNPSSASGSCA